MQPNRIEPRLPAHAVKTYGIVKPGGTHWRPATCEEVDCEPYRLGWRVRVEGLTPELLHTARNSGRFFTEQRVAEGETWLVFAAGQRCFRATTHRVEVGREPLYLVKGGDWRGNPRGDASRRHTNGEDWVDDFATHQQKLAERLEQG